MIGVGCVDITSVEKEYVNRVLDSGLITAGPVLDKFESAFASVHGCKYGLMVNSGTDALRIALAALAESDGWKDGEVIVPALTFIATSNIVIQNGLTPVFVDVDPITFNIDPAKLAHAITSKTRAIIVVHLFGLPCDMTPIMAAARANKLRVIEDSCETMGVKHRGKMVGSFGDIACFSTYAAHIISTGVGGLAITSDVGLAGRMRSFANHGRDPFFLGFRDSKQLNPGNYRNDFIHAGIIEKRFRFDRIGYSSRVTQMEAAIGLGQLERLQSIVDQRANNFLFMQTQLRDIPGIQLQAFPTNEPTEHAAMMFPVVLTGESLDRADVTFALEQAGIETRPFFNILGQSPYIERFGNIENQYPVAAFLSRRGFYVASHQLLDPSDLWQIVDSIKDVIAAKRKVAA